MDINIAVTDANNITLEVTPTPTQTITIDRGIAGPQGPAGPAGGGATSVSVVSANGLAGTVANPTTTPAITLSTTVTGIVKGNGTALSAATAGTDYAPATSGSSILYGNSAGGFNNVTVGSGLSFAAGTLAATGGATGDVVGPASATNKAIVTFDGTTGKLIQNNSGNTIGTTGNTVIEVTDNTNAALRITQLGTGNALLVEDSTNPDSSPFVIDEGGNVIVGYIDTVPTQNFSGIQITPTFQNHGTNSSVSSNGLFNWSSTATAAATLAFSKSISGTIGTRGALTASGSTLGGISFTGDDGTSFIPGAAISSFVDGTPGTNDMPGRLVFSTTADGASTPTERMRIDSAGNVGIGTTPAAGRGLVLGKAITGSTTSRGITSIGAVQSDVTTQASYFATSFSTQATTFTLGQLQHFYALQGAIGAGSTVTNQYGFSVDSTLTGATNNYGFYGNIASGTNRYNLYMAGTAANYLGGDTIVNGKIGLGTAASPSYGTAGQVLTSAGSGASPTWSAVSLTAGVSGILPLANGGTNATSAPAAMANLMGFTSTATAAGTTTLDNTNSYYQIFTGTTTQTIVLPVTSTLATGWTFHLCNNSTGVLTVNSSGGNLVISIPAGTTAMCTCIGTALTTAADWEAGFTDFSTATGTGSVVLATSPTVNNPTVTNYVESVVAIGTVTTSNTISLTNGTVQTATLTASTACTFTMPTAVAGKSFILLLKQAATTGNGTATFTGVKWSSTGTPTMTATAGRMDIFTFTSDGTNWYGNAAQGYTP